MLTGRNLVHIKREPLQLSDVTVQPVLFTLLFVYVFGAGVVLPGGGSYKDFAIAGLLAMNLTTSAMGTAVGLSTDLGSGVIDRFRTLPMWRPAVLVGRSLADVADRRHLRRVRRRDRPGHRLATRRGRGVDRRRLRHLPAVQLRPLVGLCLSGDGQQEPRVRAGDRAGDPVSRWRSSPTRWFPTEHMPAVLRAIADWNPVSAVTAACRQLFGEPQPIGERSTPGRCSTRSLASLLWSVALVAIFAPLATSLYRRRTTD